MAWPGMTLVVLVAVFGLYAILEGLTNLLHGLMHDDALGASSATALQGAIGIIVGVLVSVWPSITTVLLVTFMGSWAAANGVLEIEEGIRFRYEIIDEWLLALNGFLSLLFALAVFAFPGPGAITLAWMLGLLHVVCLYVGDIPNVRWVLSKRMARYFSFVRPLVELLVGVL